ASPYVARILAIRFLSFMSLCQSKERVGGGLRIHRKRANTGNLELLLDARNAKAAMDECSYKRMHCVGFHHVSVAQHVQFTRNKIYSSSDLVSVFVCVRKVFVVVLIN